MTLAALSVGQGMALAAAAGLIIGAMVNWAAYWWAWNRRHISPWSPAHPQAPPRRLADRIPLWGWVGLRRETALHGKGFWIRPIIVELLSAGGLAALYWWEVGQQGLVAKQFDALAAGGAPPGLLTAPAWITVTTFASHALLLAFMAAATLIDMDEKTIPDQITIPGTLLALLLAAAAPMSLPPHVTLSATVPAAGVEIPLPPQVNAGGAKLLVEPLTLAAPSAWPAELGGAPRPLGLAIGLGCYATWCYALAPRIWRRRRGLWFGLQVLLARAARELTRGPLLWIGSAGLAAIVLVWLAGGAGWVGLLTALVGMTGGGAIAWAVRIVGSAALRKEAMGFGDVTLMMMIGAFLGWQSTIFVFFLAPFAGLVVGVLQVIFRRDDVIPYGPFLCLAALAVAVRWPDFWNGSPDSFQRFFDVPWLVPAVLAVGVAMLGAILVLWRALKEGLFGGEARSDG